MYAELLSSSKVDPDPCWGLIFSVLWPAMADILRSQKPLEEEARGQPALAQTHASMDISGLRTQNIIRQTI